MLIPYIEFYLIAFINRYNIFLKLIDDMYIYVYFASLN